MAAALVPDLRAAAKAAREIRDYHHYRAVWHLLPRMHWIGDRRYDMEPHQGLAVEQAELARAADYEMQALLAAAALERHAGGGSR